MENTRLDQIIIHVDMDAFYASVEIRDDPSLKGKPLIIGALPSERGVVATCSYEARKYGVRSGMNIKEAYRLCPGGIFMHPDMEKYKSVSAELHKIWDGYASASEAVAYDEAYLDVTRRAGDFEGARAIAQEIKRRTFDELGLTCSVGLAYSKTAAKTASEEKKPDGYFEIPTPEAFVDLISDRDVRVLYTVGDMTAEKLHNSGIHTVRDLRENSDKVVSLLGKQGRWLAGLARGIDGRPVVPYRPEGAKSIGREVTFQQDTADFGFLSDVLLLLSFSVERRAKRVGLKGRGITLKLTYSDMKSITRSRSVSLTDSAADIYAGAVEMLGKTQKNSVRLIGVSLVNLTGDEERQIRFEDYLESADGSKEDEKMRLLGFLRSRYDLDFASHLDDIYKPDVLHKTIEYMRKHSGKKTR